MKLLIDADIVAFRSGFSAEEEECWVACSRADGMISEMQALLGVNDVELWLSGPDNFRYSVYPEYKANRITAKRPRWEHEIKQHLTDQWGAKWSQGCEADDMLGVRQVELSKTPQQGMPLIPSIICTIDKDLDMIPGWHYNFVKKERYHITNEEAIKFFYYQCLVGDTADGIKGVPGIGPKKAANILAQCSTEAEYYTAVSSCFGCYEEFEMTAKCLWIHREVNGIWKDPFKETNTMD
jgi:DNA polymerase-1